MTRRLQAEGYDYSSDEYHDQTEAFEERKAASDEYYDEGRLDESDEMRDMIVQSRARAGLPPLGFIADAPYDALSEALAREFYEDEAYGPFGKKNLRPLVALLHTRNGFKGIYHGLLKSHSECLGWWDDVHHIEMLGAEAPHGFFAGVYIMVRYT